MTDETAKKADILLNQVRKVATDLMKDKENRFRHKGASLALALEKQAAEAKAPVVTEFTQKLVGFFNELMNITGFQDLEKAMDLVLNCEQLHLANDYEIVEQRESEDSADWSTLEHLI